MKHQGRKKETKNERISMTFQYILQNKSDVIPSAPDAVDMIISVDKKILPSLEFVVLETAYRGE